MRIEGLRNKNLELRSGGLLSVNGDGEFKTDDLKFGLKDEARTKKDLIIYLQHLTDTQYRYHVYKLRNKNLELRSGGLLSVNGDGEFKTDDLKFGLKDEARTKEDLIIHIQYLTDTKYRYHVYKLKKGRLNFSWF